MGQFRCLNCRTVPLEGHRFCYVCGASFPGPVPAAALRPEVEVEGSLDIRRTGVTIAGLTGLILLGVAKSLASDSKSSWPLAALLLMAGSCTLVWALQPRGERASAGGVALDVLRTVILYLLLALAVGGGLLMLLIGTCHSFVGNTS
ncbi:MAG: hypothetical protein FD180_1489 [Planctomycetota bacterium]|nr:MAG: hypothetical protein FD180_1489 [Planctomycetota bacterium]